MGTNQPWPQERVDVLRSLFFEMREGCFLSINLITLEMAKQFRGVERGSVIGKVRRLGLKRDQTVPYLAINGTIVDPTVTSFAPKSGASQSARRRRVGLTDEAARGAGEYIGAMTDTARQIVTLEGDSCRFPIGHVGHEGFHFCGATVRKGPYCELHSAVCFMEPKARNKPRPSYHR